MHKQHALHPDRRRFLQDFAVCLGSRQAGDQDDRIERRLLFGPAKFQHQPASSHLLQHRLAPGPVDEAHVELIALLATQNLQNVPRPLIPMQQGPGQFDFFEEDQIHRLGSATIENKSAPKKRISTPDSFRI